MKSHKQRRDAALEAMASPHDVACVFSHWAAILVYWFLSFVPAILFVLLLGESYVWALVFATLATWIILITGAESISAFYERTARENPRVDD